MKRHVMRFVAAASLAAMMSACGGGGSSSATPTTSASQTVSGTVVGGAAAAAKAAAITDGAAVQIVSYDKSGAKMGEASVTSDSAGGFSAQLNLSSGGGYIVVTATKENFTQYQKRIDYTTPGNIEVQAALESSKVAFATPGSALASGLGKSSESSFNFAVVSFPDGTKKALAGSAIMAAKAAGATQEVGISIPAASVPGVNKLKGELNTYDPNTQSDRFPGSYNGVDSSGKEGKMVSLAFDYLKVTDADSGKNLGDVAKALVKSGVRKAADKSTTYTRHIYSNSCDNLFLEDYDTTAPGQQVPVWSLNPKNGKWVFIGVGTVVDSSGNTVTAPSLATCKTGSGPYSLKILIANTEFSQNWWNLDHIVFTTPTEVCLQGSFSFSDGTPLAGLSISMNGSNIDGTYGRTAADGTFKLSTVLLNKDGSKNAKLHYYDENGGYSEQAVTLATSPCGSFSKTNITKPCEVSGKLIDNAGAGVAYRNIRLQGPNFYRSSGTNSTGVFSSLVKCGADTNVYVGNNNVSSATFNVNGTLTSSEKSDENNKVVLNDITAPNLPPSGFAYFANRSIKLGGTLSASLSAFDEDNNYPIAWTMTVGTATKSGSIDTTTSQPVAVEFTGLAAGEYAANLKVTDSKGANRSVSLGTVIVSDGSRPPVVNLTADRNAVMMCSQTKTFNLYGSAFDPDGDGLSGAWSLDGGAAPACDGGTGAAGTITATCSASLPGAAVAGNTYTYRYTVTDNSALAKKGSNSVNIWAINNKPWVSSLTADKTVVAQGATGAARTVNLTASAADQDGDAITGAWTVGGSAICTNATGTGSITGATCAYPLPDTATTGQVFTFRFTPSDCGGAGVYKETKVSYGQAGDVTVVVQ